MSVLKVALGTFVGIVAAVLVLECVGSLRAARQGGPVTKTTAIETVERETTAEQVYEACLDLWKHSSADDWTIRKDECRRKAEQRASEP